MISQRRNDLTLLYSPKAMDFSVPLPMNQPETWRGGGGAAAFFAQENSLGILEY